MSIRNLKGGKRGVYVPYSGLWFMVLWFMVYDLWFMVYDLRFMVYCVGRAD